MKKFVALFLCVSLLLLTGCTAKPSSDKKIIAVSFYPVYIFTMNIVDGISELSVECMAEQNTGCLHDYTITAKDARLISDCSVLVVNGAGMESFVEDLYHSEENKLIVDSSVGVELICSRNHEEEHSGHSHSQEGNSHIWLSVDNAIKQVENISAGIACAFPEGSPYNDFCVRGECKGTVLDEERGNGGFGYDPLFFVDEYGKTYAELSSEEKNKISHRAVATALFVKKFCKEIDS